MIELNQKRGGGGRTVFWLACGTSMLAARVQVLVLCAKIVYKNIYGPESFPGANKWTQILKTKLEYI